MQIRTRNESEKRLIANGSLISPNNIAVGFDDVGSLENVKSKLRVGVLGCAERRRRLCCRSAVRRYSRSRRC